MNTSNISPEHYSAKSQNACHQASLTIWSAIILLLSSCVADKDSLFFNEKPKFPVYPDKSHYYQIQDFLSRDLSPAWEHFSNSSQVNDFFQSPHSKLSDVFVDDNGTEFSREELESRD